MQVRFAGLGRYGGVVAPSKGIKMPTKSSYGTRIRVFKWRDTRHTYAGGAEVYIHELGKRWSKSGNYVTMLGDFDGKVAPRNEVIDGDNIIRRGALWFVYLWAFLYFMLRFRRKFDVIVNYYQYWKWPPAGIT